MAVKNAGVQLSSVKNAGTTLSSLEVGGRSLPFGVSLASGAVSVTQITDSTTLVGGGFADDVYDGGYLYQSTDGTGDYVGVVAFGGRGIMSGSVLSDVLTQSIGQGFNTYSDWQIDGGNKRLLVYQFYYDGALSYPATDAAKTAVKDCVEWMQNNFTLVDNKVIFAASSQGGDVFSIMLLDDGDVTGPSWVRSNVRGAYHAAAAFPNGGQDITGLDVLYISGESDSTVPYATQVARINAINSASTGTPITIQSIPGGGHAPYWDDPFNTNRNDNVTDNDYDGFITYLNGIYAS